MVIIKYNGNLISGSTAVFSVKIVKKFLKLARVYADGGTNCRNLISVMLASEEYLGGSASKAMSDRLLKDLQGFVIDDPGVDRDHATSLDLRARAISR